MQKNSLVNVTSVIFKYTRIQTKNKNWKKITWLVAWIKKFVACKQIRIGLYENEISHTKQINVTRYNAT